MSKKIQLTTILVFSPLSGYASEGVGLAAPLWSCLPFAGLLLSLALVPTVAPRFWHHHYPKVAAFWSLLLLGAFTALNGGAGLGHAYEVLWRDYLPFVIFLFALFTITGGVLIRGAPAGTPLVNTGLLAGGALAASLIGTTGAAMLLIRPYLRANAWRKARAHQIVFFIFLVCNIGGILTPLGDPPLFLGYLQGVPFLWTLGLFAPMALAVSLLLALFYLLDSHHHGKEEGKMERERGKLSVEGKANLLLLALVVFAVFAGGHFDLGHTRLLGIERPTGDFLRDAVLLLAGLVSLRITPRALHRENSFTFAPLKEVAIIFAAIFATMMPVGVALTAGKEGALGGLVASVTEPAHYFWASGLMSSVLDNAPTYLLFLNTALGTFTPGASGPQAVAALIAHNNSYLEAIALGSVFIGAVTYIGNAPNFMARTIAEELGVPMPGFIGYVVRYSAVFLIPVFLLVTYIWFL